MLDREIREPALLDHPNGVAAGLVQTASPALPCVDLIWTSLSLQDRNDLSLDWLPTDFDVFIRNVNVDF
jgi:hypothetical protein